MHIVCHKGSFSFDKWKLRVWTQIISINLLPINVYTNMVSENTRWNNRRKQESMAYIMHFIFFIFVFCFPGEEEKVPPKW